MTTKISLDAIEYINKRIEESVQTALNATIDQKISTAIRELEFRLEAQKPENEYEKQWKAQQADQSRQGNKYSYDYNRG